MTQYAIGDVQGCYTELQALLAMLHFDPAQDRLLFAGDLVNRGPQSLETLRFVRGLGAAAVTVLGNHDLHLLAVRHSGRTGPRDTLDALFAAADADELLDWLAQQPLAWQDPASGSLLIHAGLPPQWTRAQALELAAEASAVIAGRAARAFFARMYGNEPALWHDGLHGVQRLRFVVNCLTRLRYVHADGRIDLRNKSAPAAAGGDLVPWFEHPQRRSGDGEIVFGHWSTLGQVRWPSARVHGLDTGCVWGGRLTALNLATGELTSTCCAVHRRPGLPED